MRGRPNLNILVVILAPLVVLTCGSSVESRTIYVDDDGPADFSNMQLAINDSNDGDTIIVADGTYTGDGNRDIDLLGKAIVMQSERGPETCIIDCQNQSGHRGFYFHNGEEPNSIVSGFTVKRGYIYGSDAKGGGILCGGSSPTIYNCIITDNKACGSTDNWAYGGGFYIDSDSTPVIQNCIITNNKAEGGDGHSSSMDMPGKGKPAYGGGIYCDADCSVTLTDCQIENNKVTGGDGGSSLFVGSDGGNAVGGGIYLGINANLIMANCRITSNTACGSLTIYSDIRGGYAGSNNINLNPCFVSGTCRLAHESPCINSGDPNYISGPNETDMDGELRVMLGRVDMGADEFNPFKVEFVVVRKERIDRTVFEYECQVSLTNLSHFAIGNAQLEMLKVSDNIIIIDPNASFGPIEASGSATSIDTCTFRVGRSKAIDPKRIFWWSTCELADSGQIIQRTLSSIVNLEPEDTTGDSEVDLAGLADKWLWIGDAGSIKEDITGDGIVNLADFAAIAGNLH